MRSITWKRYKWVLRYLYCITALLWCCTCTHAQTEKFVQTLTGSIKRGDSCRVSDDKFLDPEKWNSIEKHLAVDNLITFEIRYDTSLYYFDRNFTCRLDVDISYEKADKTKQELKNIALELSYDSTPGSVHRGICFYKFRGATMSK